MNDIFGSVANKYFEAGYNVLPLEPNTKKPFIKNWQQWCSNKQSSFTVDSWAYTYAKHNIGIPLGETSNIIALDFDNDIDGLHDKITALLNNTMPIKKSGFKGFTTFFRYNGESPKKWYKDGQAVLELLSTGNQTVMPPSIHPDTKEPYKWLTPDTLLDVPASELPTLPVGFIENVDKIFGYEKRLPKYNHFEGEVPDIKEVEKALSFVPSNEYATWITVGMALHYTYNYAGFDVWDAWSRKAQNYDAKIMAAKWQSFGRSNKTNVTIGTIFHYALNYGYTPPAQEPIFDFELDLSKFQISIGNSRDIIEPSTSTLEDSNFPEYLLDAPGLPGEIASWINSTAIKRQPILSLGAAICAAGTIFAHRIRNDSNLRTNFMVLGLAESGSGKNHPRECIKSLFNYCDLSQYTFGKFASDAALLNSLGDTNGIGLALIDEIGRELKCLNNPRAGGHETRLLTLMMEIYSEAGTHYDGKRYASNENNKRLEQPCLNIYGTTVPKRLYDSLNSDDAIDGFLARWLLFPSEDIDPPMQQRGNVELPPEQLANNIRFIQGMRNFKEPLPGFVGAPIPDPRVIPYTDGAEDILRNLSNACNENRIAEIRRGGNLAPIWARTREHAIKLALVAHPYRSGAIERVTMSWACNMALHLSHLAIKAIRENISDSDYEKSLKRVHTIIKRYNEKTGLPMKAWKVADAIRSLKPRERNEIIAHLVESGQLISHEEQYNGKLSYSYTAK